MTDRHSAGSLPPRGDVRRSFIPFIKRWMLPIAMVTGVLAYFIYVNIPALDGTHVFMNKLISIVQPLLLFLMLFCSFCKVSPRELRPKRWMLGMLLIQAVSFVLLGLFIVAFPSVQGRIVIESAMLCMICPTATAAAVVTIRLGGRASVVVSYTVMINLVTSILVPAIVPLLHEVGGAGDDFLTSFYLIIGKVFPLLLMPLLLAWFVRYLMPAFHAKVLEQKDLAFNLWAVSLSLAIGVSVKAIVHSEDSFWTLVGIAIVSLFCCLLQFYLGHKIGVLNHHPVEGTQSMGQKNTVFLIWLGYTFMNPLTALAGGFYSIWHNVINSYQLVRKEK